MLDSHPVTQRQPKRDPANLWNLPSDVDAERALLGGLLTDPSQHADARDRVVVDDFSHPGHRALWAHLCGLADTSPLDAPPYTMSDVMGDAWDRQEEWGGLSYVAQLPGSCPSIEAIGLYAHRIADMGRRRRAIVAVATAGLAMSSGSDLDSALVALRTALDGVSAEGGGSDHVSDILAAEVVAVDLRVQRRRQAERDGTLGQYVDGATTGIIALDAILGGLRSGDLCVLAARPAMGKTSASLGMALDVAGLGRVAAQPVFVVSLEMSKAQLADRLACYEARVSTMATRLGDLSDRQHDDYHSAAERVSALPIYVLDGPSPLRRIRSEAMRLKSRLGRLGLIVVDYLQLMPGDTKAGNREQEVAGNARGLKLLAQEIGCAVLLLSQLNRNLEQRANKRPMMSDLRESGAIEQDADQIVGLFRPVVYDETANPDHAEAIVLKNRNGTLGTATMGFVLGRFVEAGE